MSLASALNISLGILRSFGNGFLNTQSLAGCSWTPSRLLHPVLQAKPVKIVEPPSEQLDSALEEAGFCPWRGWILPSERLDSALGGNRVLCWGLQHWGHWAVVKTHSRDWSCLWSVFLPSDRTWVFPVLVMFWGWGLSAMQKMAVPNSVSSCPEVLQWMLPWIEIKLNINSKAKRIRVQAEGLCACFIKAYEWLHDLKTPHLISVLFFRSLVPLRNYLFLSH